MCVPCPVGTLVFLSPSLSPSHLFTLHYCLTHFLSLCLSVIAWESLSPQTQTHTHTHTHTRTHTHTHTHTYPHTHKHICIHTLSHSFIDTHKLKNCYNYIYLIFTYT